MTEIEWIGTSAAARKWSSRAASGGMRHAGAWACLERHSIIFAIAARLIRHQCSRRIPGDFDDLMLPAGAPHHEPRRRPDAICAISSRMISRARETQQPRAGNFINWPQTRGLSRHSDGYFAMPHFRLPACDDIADRSVGQPVAMPRSRTVIRTSADKGERMRRRDRHGSSQSNDAHYLARSSVWAIMKHSKREHCLAELPKVPNHLGFGVPL